jgi:hypothetical protein
MFFWVSTEKFHNEIFVNGSSPWIDLPKWGPHDFWHFISYGYIFGCLGFLTLVFIVKRPSEPHCNHILANASSHHISSQR